MIGGKLQDITRDDVIQFARDNGIRRPDAIIRDVVDYCFGLGGVIIGTTLGAYVFKRISNRIFRYIVYAYIAISGVIILLS